MNPNRDKNTILNEMVMQAADLMEMKIGYFQLLIDQYVEKGDIGRVEYWTKERDKTQECVDFMRERGGCWA